jgi:hypothetical protein
MKKRIFLAVAIAFNSIAWAQDTVYWCDFDHPTDTSGWQMVNGSQPNYWMVGAGGSVMGNGLFITDNGLINTYDNVRSVVFAYKRVVLPRGVSRIAFDWRCNGLMRYGIISDFLRVLLLPVDVPLIAGVVPEGMGRIPYDIYDPYGSGLNISEDYIAVDGGMPLCSSNVWVSHSYDVCLEEADTFNLVFFWNNVGNESHQPPAAIDNLLISTPVCPQPVWLHTDPLTPTGFTLQWSDFTQGATTEWLVELCTAAQSFGQGAQYMVNDTAFVFSGLISDADYRVYVRALCDGDTLDTVSLGVHTPCGLLTIPYRQDFHSVPAGTLPPCWRVLSTHGDVSVQMENWDTSTMCLGWNTSSRPYCYVVLPGIDEAVSPMTGLQLSFSCKAPTGFSNAFDVGVMANPSDIGSFVPVSTVTAASNEWEECVVEFAGHSGSYIAIRDAGSNIRRESVSFDNFVVSQAAACQQVRHLEVTHTGTTGARVVWRACMGTVNVPMGYEVYVVPDDTTEPGSWPDTGGVLLSCTEPQFLLTELLPNTAYRVWVRAQCANDSLGDWSSVLFTTMRMPCQLGDTAAVDTVTVGRDSNCVTGVPVSYYYPYTVCQSLFTAHELVDSGVVPGLISGMDYTYTNSRRDLELSIYISTTTDTSYASVADMATVREWDCVFDPALLPAGSEGVVHFEFDRPFSWDGVNNLVVTTIVNTLGATIQSPMCYGYSTRLDDNKTIYGYQTDVHFSTDNVTSGNNTLSRYRPSVSFHSMPCAIESDCSRPTLVTGVLGVDYVELEWVPGGVETSWRVLCRMEADTVWNVVDTEVFSNSCRLSSLLPMSRYVVRVVPHCGGDSLFVEDSFATACAGIDTLPYVVDFEDFEAPSTEYSTVEPCWYRRDYGVDNRYPTPYVSTDYAYSGERSLRFPSYDGYYIATPMIGVEAGRLQVSFYTYGRFDYRLRVGVMDDPMDVNTFVEVARVAPSRLYAWELHEVPLGAYRGDGRHIALMLVSGGAAYVDDLMLDYLQLCPRPQNVTATGITLTSALLCWEGGGAQGYEVEYGPAGFVLGTGSVVACWADSVRLYNLTHSTRYDVYVRAICGDDSSRLSQVFSFNTACAEIDSLPYVQDFSNQGVGRGERPTCWVCGCSLYPYEYPYVVDHTDDMGQAQGRSLYMYAEGTDRVYAMLPAVSSSLGALHTLQLTVKAASNSNYSAQASHILVLGVCQTSGDIRSFTPFDTITLTPTPTLYEVPLDGAAGLGSYLTLLSYAAARQPGWDGSAYQNCVYIDSLVLEPIPACQRPRNLVSASLSSTSATLSWTELDSPTSWQVEYMPHGRPIGTGSRIITSVNPFTVTGLTPSTYYDYYVRSICGMGDTSQWSIVPGHIITQQIPATVPYQYDFDSLSEWGSWQTLSNSPISWYRGGTEGMPAPGMFISADSGSSRCTSFGTLVNAVIYRDIDFGYHDSSYMLSFSASVGGAHLGNLYYDGLAVFLVNPDSLPAEPMNLNAHSPWGALDNLTLLANIYGVPEWTDYSIVIDSLVGVHRLVFYWYSKTNYLAPPTSGLAAAVDNINIRYEECQHPYSLRATDVTAVSASIAWHGTADGSYRVSLLSQRGAPLATDTVVGPSIHYNNLVPFSTYKVRVSRLCDGYSTPSSPLLTFSTSACTEGSVDTIGDPLHPSSNDELPAVIGSRYSYTQQLVLASELQGRGEVTSISFLYNSAYSLTAKTNCTIYMGHTTLNSFSSPFDYVSPSMMEVVYVGDLNCSKGWRRILLDSPFAYDGTSNLVIAVDDNSQTPFYSDYRFAVSGTPSTMALTLFSDEDNIDCTSLGTLNAFSGGRNTCSYRNVMKIEMCEPNPCPKPLLCAPIVRTGNIILRWQGTSDRYLFGYRMAGSEQWIEDDRLLTDTLFTITNYNFGSDYVYYVRQYCGTDDISNRAIGLFDPSNIPCLPPVGLHLIEADNRSAAFAWTPDDNNISYRLHVWGGHGYDTIVTTYLASGMVDGLTAAKRYYASVEVRCEYIDQPSIWSDTISFMTESCPDATDLEALEVHGNSALIDWQCDEGPEQWLVEWGRQGFDQGTGITVQADHHPFLLTGLTGETTYDIYVRSVCSADYVSESWSNRLTITTEYSGVSEVVGADRVHLSPNPSRGDVELLLPDLPSAVSVEVVDMAGRTILTRRLPAHTERATLSTDALPQGAYFVHIVGEDLVTVKKLLQE